MNSELLAQMKNKLIKLKQPSAQPQPTPPNDPRPP